MVGRTDELARLRALRTSGRSNGAVIIGPAGVGKSRLAHEAAAEAQSDGTFTVRVAGTSAAARLPFGAFAPLLPPPVAEPDVMGRGDVMRRLHAALVEKAGGQRFVLMADDAHLLDDDSATLTRQLAATGSAFVLATVRTGEQLPKAVTALWETGLAEAVMLSGLSDDAVAQLLVDALGGPVEEATIARLASQSQGNVLLLRELVLGAVASGVLRSDGGAHRLVKPLTLSDRLVEVLETRFADLNDQERRVLEFLAVGAPLGPAELAAACGDDVLDDLENLGLVHRRLDGRRFELRLAHPLYADVLRAGLAALRLRSVHRGLADALEATGARRREDSLRLATWRLDGGGTVRADVMLAGARVARNRWALRLAERLARASFDAGGGFEAGLLLGQLYAFHGRAEEAERILAGLAAHVDGDEQRGLLAASRMYNLAAWGPLDEALRVADEADSTISDPASRDEVAASRALVLGLAGRTTEALAVVVPVLSRADGRALASAGFSGSVALGLVGRLDEAIIAADRGVETYRQLVGPGLGIDAFMCSAMRMAALVYGGRIEEAATWGKSEYDAAVTSGSAGARAFLSMYLARALVARGRVEAAARRGEEAVGLYRAGGFLTLFQTAAPPLIQAWAYLGRIDEARALLVELADLGLDRDRVYIPELLQARAWTELADGDPAAAHDLLEEAVALARANGELVLESAALHDLARIGRSEAVVFPLEAVAKQIEGGLAQTRAAHAAALAANHGQALQDVSATFEAMGADLMAAEAAAQAAFAFRAGGDDTRARSASDQAARLAARCEGAVTPALNIAF